MLLLGSVVLLSAAELDRRRNQILRGVLHDEPPGDRLSGEPDLGDARVGCECLPDLGARAGDNVDDALGEGVLDDLCELQDRPGCGRCRLDDGAVAAA